MRWKKAAKTGERVAGVATPGSAPHELYHPTDIMVHKETESLIICDQGNNRVVRWPLQNSTRATTILPNIPCYGLAMDQIGHLYITNIKTHTVMQYQMGDTNGTIVAGGNGAGVDLNQLNEPRYVFVDRDRTLFVSDYKNHRVMKWIEGATEGIVVAGGHGEGGDLHQLSYPNGIVLDQSGAVYVSDHGNHRIMRWSKGASYGTLFIGGSQAGLLQPVGLSFDSFGNLFVSEYGNHRVQRFDLVWTPLRSSTIDLPVDASWRQRGITVAGGNSNGSSMNQLYLPFGLFVDEDQTVYVADSRNARIIQWKLNAEEGVIVTRSNEKGNDSNQLHQPTDVLMHKSTQSLIICDSKNRRVIRWPLQNGTTRTTISSNVDCCGLSMDRMGNLHVADYVAHVVMRYQRDETHGKIVAGVGGPGERLNQLNEPRYVFVDDDDTVYVSDFKNHRVMKWIQGATQGIVVAGGHRIGMGLHQLSYPNGIVVDSLGTVYVSDSGNNRIMGWPKGATQGRIVIGGPQAGLLQPVGLSFDSFGNLFVSDYGNHRVQRFDRVWTPLRSSTIDLPVDASWQQRGITVAGGNSNGSSMNQLDRPFGLFVTGDETVYVADIMNGRVMKWTSNAKAGEIAAFASGEGTNSRQLFKPADVVLDQKSDSLIICEAKLAKVIQWPLRKNTTGVSILNNTFCCGLSMDRIGYLYVVVYATHVVMRYQRDETHGTIVAGVGGPGERLNELNEPRYVFVDDDYTVYVSDFKNHRVMKWIEGATQGIVVAGGHRMGMGLHQLSYPNGIVVDSFGTVYVSDEGNNRVMGWPKGATQGRIVIGGPQAGLLQPVGLSFDSFGNLFVSDYGNHRVQRFNLVWTPLRSSTNDLPVHASWRQRGITVAGGNNNGNSMNQLHRPFGLFVTGDDTVYVADTMNARVMKWTLNVNEGTIVAGGSGRIQPFQLYKPLDIIVDEKTHSLIICDLQARKVFRWLLRNGRKATSIVSNIDCSGLAIDRTDSLYVANLTAHAVMRYRRDDTHGKIVAGVDGPGERLNQLNEPRYVFVDDDDTVYVSDFKNHRVMKWIQGATQGIVVAGGHGKGGDLCQLSYPNGIVVDSLGTVYVSDEGNNRIMGWPKGATQGRIVIGGPQAGLLQPVGLSFDSFGNLFVSEYGNHRVQRFDLVWTPLRSSTNDLPVDASWRQRGITVAGGNSNGSSMNQLHRPFGLFVDDNGILFVADAGNGRIMEWKFNDKVGKIAAGGTTQPNVDSNLVHPTDVIVDPKAGKLVICDSKGRKVMQWPLGNGTRGAILVPNIACCGLTMDHLGELYVSDFENHAVKRFQREPSSETIVAGGNGAGERHDQLNQPRYVFVDRDQTVYVSDYNNHRVMKWRRDAREGIVVAGGHGFGDGLHQLYYPNGVVVDQLGTVYVSDERNNRIMGWSKGASEGKILIGGLQAGLYFPIGLSFDHSANLFVSDIGNSRVQRFEFSWTPLRSTAIDIPVDATWREGGVTVAGGNSNGSAINQFDEPCGLFVDADQTLYVADSMNARVLEWKLHANESRIVAGGNGEGREAKKLHVPRDVILEEKTNSLIISDSKLGQVLRWPLGNSTRGTTILSGIGCGGLTMDHMGYLYVSDFLIHAVRRYERDNSHQMLVAGGNGPGERRDQLKEPRYIFVDGSATVFVSDYFNHRVMKWKRDAREGVIVAGGHGFGNGLHQLSYPCGVVVDQSGTVYVSDEGNNRIMRWLDEASHGVVIIGGSKAGLNEPIGLSFDRFGNILVSDRKNHRVQLFDLIK